MKVKPIALLSIIELYLSEGIGSSQSGQELISAEGAKERNTQDIAVFYLLLMKHVLIKRAVISWAVLGYVNRC